MTAPHTPPLSERARKALRMLAKVSTELSRPITKEEWDEGLGSLVLSTVAARHNDRAIEELIENKMVDQWRGAYRISRHAVPLLRRGGLGGIDPHDSWALSGNERPVGGKHAERVSQLDELLPLGYGDVIVRITDDQYALADARPGDVLIFRHAHTVNPGDLYLETGQDATPTGLITATTTSNDEWVLVTLIRSVAAPD